MDEYMARDLYRLLPFMFVLHFLVLGSLFFVALMGGAYDYFLSEITGFEATCVTLPFALGLSFLSLVVYPRLKTRAETPAMLLLTFTMILNGVLAFEAVIVWYTYIRWYG